MGSSRYRFTKQTLKFCIIGFFIPGFTAILIFGMQLGLTLLGIECTTSWAIVWVLTCVGMIVAPLYFVRRMKRTLHDGYHLSKDSLIAFNLIEYSFIQSTLTAFFSNPRTLCYVSDGQNGLEFVFTAWMALPVLVVLSLIFDTLRENEMEEL